VQREYVEDVVHGCRALGLEVFYDADAQVELWGRNLITELRKVYADVNTRYVVPFLSRDYFAGRYPMDEFRAGLLRQLDQEDYFLPVLMDDVEIPAEYLSPATGYLRAADYPPDQLARVIAQRIGHGDQHSRSASPLSSSIRRPRLVPTRFSAERTLQEALRHVGVRFTDEVGVLENYGFLAHVRTSADEVTVLIEDRGRPKCELRLARGGSTWSGALTMAFGWPRITSSGVNGFVRAELDPDEAAAKLRYQDLTASGAEPLLTTEELFQELWDKLVKHLEQTTH
jgi:hypothetical protein